LDRWYKHLTVMHNPKENIKHKEFV
jgi:hypothetical protein